MMGHRLEGGATGRRQLNIARISRKKLQKFIYKADSFRRSGCLSSGARGNAMAETNIEVRSRDGTLTAPWANQISRHSLLHPPPRPRTITPPLDHYFDARASVTVLHRLCRRGAGGSVRAVAVALGHVWPAGKDLRPPRLVPSFKAGDPTPLTCPPARPLTAPGAWRRCAKGGGWL